MPTVDNLRRENGVAGQIAVSALVTYPDEVPAPLTFVGSVYGGPVTLIDQRGFQYNVSDPGRFGDTFGVEWVKRFFKDA